MTDGYIKLMRSTQALALVVEDPRAFALLTVIAWRAKRADTETCNGLKRGQCMMGDYENVGMTRGMYRSAIKRLKKGGFIDAKATTKGTIVTLFNDEVYDINAQGEQPTNSQQSAIKVPLTRSKKKEVINYSADFLKLWNTYPTKATMSKRKAFESFQKTDTPVETLMAAVETLKKSREWKKDAGQFIPHLATWLNGGGWEAAIEIPTSRKAETDTAKQAAQLKEYEQFKTEMSGYVKEANAVALKVKCRGDWKMKRLIRELRPEIKF